MDPRTTSRRSFLSLALGAPLAATALAACGSDGPSDSSGGGGGAAKDVATYWYLSVDPQESIRRNSVNRFNKFSAAAQEFVAKARQHPAVGAIGTSFRVSAPRIYAKVNRERAKALGVPISEVFDTMQAFF